jgi:hypothetical protein
VLAVLARHSLLAAGVLAVTETGWRRGVQGLRLPWRALRVLGLRVLWRRPRLRALATVLRLAVLRLALAHALIRGVLLAATGVTASRLARHGWLCLRHHAVPRLTGSGLAGHWLEPRRSRPRLSCTGLSRPWLGRPSLSLHAGVARLLARRLTLCQRRRRAGPLGPRLRRQLCLPGLALRGLPVGCRLLALLRLGRRLRRRLVPPACRRLEVLRLSLLRLALLELPGRLSLLRLAALLKLPGRLRLLCLALLRLALRALPRRDLSLRSLHRLPLPLGYGPGRVPGRYLLPRLPRGPATAWRLLAGHGRGCHRGALRPRLPVQRRLGRTLILGNHRRGVDGGRRR